MILPWEGAFNRDRGQNNEEKYRRSNAEGQRVITHAVRNWRLGQGRKNKGESKRISKQAKKTTDNIHSPENIKHQERQLRKKRKKMTKTNNKGKN